MANEQKKTVSWLPEILQSTKFWWAILGVAMFMTLALTGTMHFTEQQAMEIILGLCGLGIAGHTVTNVAAVLAQRNANASPPAVDSTTNTEETKD